MSKVRLWSGSNVNLFPVKAQPIYLKGERFCPQCGNALVRRRGRYGNFLGCSKYPDCTYAIKFKGR